MINKMHEAFLLLIDSFSKDTRKRIETRMSILRFIANRFGAQVYKSNLSWPHDNEYKDIYKNFITNGKFGPHDRKFTLVQFLKLIQNLEGDTAECGVYKGASSFIILSKTQGQNRTHYCFDSFEGLSNPNEKDLNITEKGFKWKKNDLSSSQAILEENLSCFNNVFIKKGWIPERFNEVSEKKFAFVHIDVDLEQPTRDSLEFFYPRITPGGVIIVDDYGFESCPGARYATDDFMSNVNEVVLHLTTGQGVILKSHGGLNG